MILSVIVLGLVTIQRIGELALARRNTRRLLARGAVEADDGVRPGRHLMADLGEVEVHRLGVARRQDERRTFAFHRTNRAEYIGRCGALVVRR